MIGGCLSSFKIDVVFLIPSSKPSAWVTAVFDPALEDYSIIKNNRTHVTAYCQFTDGV
jgi:hypothetical protein